jgi:hypothetical protein
MFSEITTSWGSSSEVNTPKKENAHNASTTTMDITEGNKENKASRPHAPTRSSWQAAPKAFVSFLSFCKKNSADWKGRNERGV